jgi:hypothetical protein
MMGRIIAIRPIIANISLIVLPVSALANARHKPEGDMMRLVILVLKN